MLKVDTRPTPTNSWTKVQALTNFIQLNSLNSPAASTKYNATARASPSDTRNAAHPQRSSPCQPKSDRLKIFIGSWNMKGRLIELEPFLNILQPSVTNSPTENPTSQSDSGKILVEQSGDNGVSPFLESSSLHPYHLLAIGTQECERDISESLFYPSKEVWESKLSDYLGNQYKLLRCETLAAVHVAVFVWKPVAAYVKNVHSAAIKTGWANMVGNKGAVAVSLDFGSQSLLFINCHLRAHQAKLAERNANIHRILHELQIKGGKATRTQPNNTIFRIPSIKKLAKSSKSTKSTKSAKSAKLKESSGKVEIAKEHHNTPSTNMKPVIKDRKKVIGTNPSKNSTGNKATSSKSTEPTKSENTPNKISGDTKRNKNTSPSIKSVGSARKKKNGPEYSSSTSADDQHSVMEQFAHVFLFGDTNYRLNLNTRQFVLDTIQKQDFQTLLKYDQLTLERQQCTTPLATFKEHPINFIPTYKFDTLETIPTTTESSSSLPVNSAATTTNCKTKPLFYPPSASSAPSSIPQTPVTAMTTSSSSSSSQSFVITPTDSLHSNGSISVRYDTSPKQRIPSWTDRILWHDREQQQPSDDISTTTPAPLSASGPTMASIATTATTYSPNPHSKSKLNLKWISALTRKNKSGGLERGVVERPVDKSTVCYHYNTVMDPRLMGASDHLPVIGIFGVWFDDWESGTSIKRTRSIKSIKKKIPLWKKWLQ
ncbi:hypothetical protein BCR42DRAFT_88158 [Absidia repens]|uniref:Inositol polyphosphate-related phosphatase domain-containing protein n=1 Tax=Absidia repens TaxID=90262 RepID=A0A1X2IY80_9FUNG|nr:hypothetical protein BCR42DRAFT_88158 [Absidia repens]